MQQKSIYDFSKFLGNITILFNPKDPKWKQNFFRISLIVLGGSFVFKRGISLK